MTWGGTALAVWFAATLGGAACTRTTSSADLSSCRAALRSQKSDAIALCSDLFSRTGDPAAGGYLARALVDQGHPLAEVRAVATRVGDHPEGAEAWNAVGDMLRDSDDGSGSIAAYDRALVHRSPGDVRGRVRDAVGLLHQYADVEKYRPAVGYAGLAYQLVARDGDRELRGYVLSSIASMLFDLGAMPAVEALVKDADSVVDETSPFFANLRYLHATIQLSHGHLGLAKAELARASSSAKQLGLTGLQRNIVWATIEIDLAQGDVAHAEQVLASDGISEADDVDDRMHHASAAARTAIARGDHEEAVAITTRALAVKSEGWIGTLEALRGAALARMHRNRDAEKSLLVAIGEIERRRAEVELDALKPGLLQEEWHWPFEDLFVLYVEEHRFDDAFEVAQRASARSVLDGLLHQAAPVAGSVQDELVRAGDQASGLRVVAHSLRASGSVQPPPTNELRRMLGDRQVLSYIHAREQLWVMSAYPGQPIVIERVGAIADLKPLVDTFVEDPGRRRAARALGQRLVPATVMPAAGTTVYVVADEPVREVAFAALELDGGLMIERGPVVYAPSAAVLAQLARTTPGRGPSIVIGDPRGDLPAARDEATLVASALTARPILGAAATVSAVVAAPRPAVLHVAAHTVRSGFGPAILFADAALSAGEIIDRSLGADLVVLMSCASADPRDHEELGPVAAAFLATGSRTVVASRWSVADATAREFARVFYAGNGATDPATAVANAQRKLIRDGVPASTWTTFVVFGDGAAKSLKGSKE